MSLINPAVLLNTTFSNKNISSAASVYDYTAIANGKINIAVKLTNAAGNGDYIIYLKRQWLGTGTASTILGKATFTAASGETVIEFQTMMVSVFATDIISVFIDGLAGDTAVNGNIQILQDNYSVFDNTIDAVVNTTLTRLATMLQLDGAVYQYTANALELSPATTVNLAVTSTTAQQVAAGDLSMTSHYSGSQVFTSTITADLSTADLWLTVKTDKNDLDEKSLFMVKKGTGLLYIAGTAPISPVVAADASLTVSGSSGAWSILVVWNARASAVLDGIEGAYVTAIKYSLGTDDLPVSEGTASINQGTIRAT